MTKPNRKTVILFGILLLLIVGILAAGLYLYHRRSELMQTITYEYGTKDSGFFDFSDGTWSLEIIPQTTRLSGIDLTFAQCDEATGSLYITLEKETEEAASEILFAQTIALEEVHDRIVTPFIATDCRLDKGETYILKIQPADISGNPLLYQEDICAYYKFYNIKACKRLLQQVWKQNEWYNRYQAVAHALGGIDGAGSLNCLEGFENAYQNGYRVFETDMVLTADHKIVLRHDWELSLGQNGLGEGKTPTEEEFLNAGMNETYTPLSLQNLIEIMNQYPDIYVITDIKDQESMMEMLAMIASDMIEDGNEQLLNRMIIQIYDYQQYEQVKNIYDFPNIILTFYLMENVDYEEAALFCESHDIAVVVMPYFTLNQQKVDILKGYGLKIYAHTYNDANVLEEQRQWIDGYYTDFLMPDLLDN
jgi:glycerophosphoryl diester phosphodiesterase